MNKIRSTLIQILLFVLMTNYALAGSVGTAPGFIDFGNVERGDEIEQEIYVTTSFDSNFTISPAVRSTSNHLMFNDNEERRFETSEQDSKEWINPESEAMIDPSSELSAELPGGTVVNAEGSFNLAISIPQDAEPGYHYSGVRLNPELTAEDEEDRAGTRNWGESVLNFRFRVVGDVSRDIVAQDVRGFRTEEDTASVEVLLRNTGTVTTSINDFELSLLDRRGEEVADLEASGMKLAPGESGWTNAIWSDQSVEEGTYEVDGDLDYMTGSAYASGSFSLDDVVEVVPEDSPEGETSESSDIPIWLVVMILAVLGVLMWSFEVDPVWIFGIVGMISLSAFIIISSISNLLLLGVLIPVILLIYLGG